MIIIIINLLLRTIIYILSPPSITTIIDYKKKNKQSFLSVITTREMLRLQYFYNKSQVDSYYWFKFQTNAKITFLLQQ